MICLYYARCKSLPSDLGIMIEVYCTCRGGKHKGRNHTRKKLALAVRKAKARRKKVQETAIKNLLSDKVKIVNKEEK